MHSLLGLERAGRDEISAILDLAEQFVSADDRLATPERYRRALDGASIALLFFEPSTRTRASFELAVQRLGGYPLSFAADSSSMRKGESELDTCFNLAAMGVDGFVIRHVERHIPVTISEQVGVPVFNAGNGSGEHPTQGLLDLFTLRRALDRKDLEGVRVAIIGDIVHSRVARSDVFGLRALGASVVVAGPPSLLPTQRDDWDVDFVDSRAEALADADAVMLLRVQRERLDHEVMTVEEYSELWGVNEAVVATQMKPDAWVMHPGPVMRGVELSGAVADSEQSLILKQVTFGVAVRQAALLYVMGQT